VARIKDASVEDVKTASDIVAVVSARTQLRKTGGRYMGRCPFHEERTPSFSVNPVEKFYYCFGCGAKGDLITFVRETEQLDFAGAIEWLADRFNVQIEYEETTPQQDARRRRRERLLELLDAAAMFYERYLWDSQAGSLARDYLAGRGLREEVCREYRLGLALGGTVLTRKALERGFTREELVAAGLLNRRGSDYFARRLVFPLADARGRVLGFQARKLHEDDPLRAKYVNSPEGELFRKGDLLYGLDRARAAIAKQDRAVVVEGNPDVLALRQAAVEPVVAPMGTALTDRQLKELSRLTGTQRGRQPRCAGWIWQRHRDSRCTSSPCPRASIRPISPTGSSSGSAPRRRTWATAFASRSSVQPTGRRRLSACARSLPASRTHRSGRTQSATQLTSSTCRGRRRPAWRHALRRPRQAKSRRGCSTPAPGSSATRSPA
jgi:DNA primase catalytic core